MASTMDNLTPPREAFQTRLAETIQYLSGKAAALPTGTVTQLRQDHPQCLHLERRIEASVLEGKFAETTELCREYCRYWLQLVRTVAP